MPPIMPNEAFRSRRNTLSSFSLKNKVQYLKRNTNLRRYNSNNSLTNWPLEHECNHVDRTLNITIVGAPGEFLSYRKYTRAPPEVDCIRSTRFNF